MATVWIKTLFGFWVNYPASNWLCLRWWSEQARYHDYPFYIEWHAQEHRDG